MPRLTHSQTAALRVLRDALADPDADDIVHGPSSDAHVNSLRALCRMGLAYHSYGPYYGAHSIEAVDAALAQS